MRHALFTLIPPFPLDGGRGQGHRYARNDPSNAYLGTWRRAFWAQLNNLGSGMVFRTSDLPIQARRAVATPSVMFSN